MFCIIDNLWPHTAAGTEEAPLIRTWQRWSVPSDRSPKIMDKRYSRLTLHMCLRGWFQVLHRVKQAALKNAGAAALTHDPDAALLLLIAGQAAVLIVHTGLAESPTPLSFILKLLGFSDDVTAGL